MGPTHARRRTPRAVLVGALATAFAFTGAGCGEDEFANDRRPATPITVGVVVTPRGVTVSPSHFGAGTIELLASNQTGAAQRVRLRSERVTPGAGRLEQTTGPISPGGVATLKADVDPGTYVVSAAPKLGDARIIVGAPRESAQDRVLQP